MRSEETMPLRRGGCGDDCMPTTSVNEKMKMGGRGRENQARALLCITMGYSGQTISTYKCPTNINSLFLPPLPPSFLPSSSSPAFSTQSSSRQATTTAISSS